MKTETFVSNEEAAKGLIRAMLEDEEITDFEIWILSSGQCKVVMWMNEGLV